MPVALGSGSGAKLAARDHIGDGEGIAGSVPAEGGMTP
jgi:hypothetical protein